jgi:hypothetical protein
MPILQNLIFIKFIILYYGYFSELTNIYFFIILLITLFYEFIFQINLILLYITINLFALSLSLYHLIYNYLYSFVILFNILSSSNYYLKFIS